MRRSWPAPEQNEEGPLERLMAAVARLFPSRGSRQQAQPLSSYRGPSGPIVPYHERRQQLGRGRHRDQRPYAVILVVVLLVLAVGLVVYGLAWALGSLSIGGGGRATSTTGTQSVAVASGGTPTVSALPTAAPGGSSPSPSPGTGAPAPPGPATPAPAATPEPRTYVVRPGDTPGSIAQQFNVSPEALVRANNITDPRTLRIGQTLVIPPPSTPTPTR